MLKDYKIKVDSKNQQLLERISTEKVYKEFVKSQEDGFIRFINFINSIIDNLKQRAKISPFIEIRARIKDTNSALKNYNNDKLLDDVFGVEIICANENEITIIKAELEKYLKKMSSRTKAYNKPNGYKAFHESYSVKSNSDDTNLKQCNLQDSDVPVIECQFKTIEVELNPEASHHGYKKVNREEIQKELENKTLKIGKEIPKMWVSRENGFHELEYKEIIQRIYPFIDTTTIKELEKDVKLK